MAEASIRQPRRKPRDRIAASAEVLRAQAELTTAFVRRELGVRYKEAYMGIAWALLQPLAYMVIFTVLFQRMAKLPGASPLSAFVALVPWTFTSTAITAGSHSILNQLGVVGKVYFRRSVLPLAAIIAAGADALIALTLQLALLLRNPIGIRATMLFWPPLMVLTGALCMGIALLLAPAIVRFRDLRFVVPLGVQILMLASPVGYSIAAVPADLRVWYRLNPFAGLMEAFRSIALGGNIPWVRDLTPAIIWTVGLLVLGGLFFRSQQGTIADFE